MAMVIRTCQQCGKEYRTHHTVRPKYCTQECYSLACRKGETATCAHCGKEFYKQASKKDKRFCSISCAVSARNLTEQNPSYSRDITGEQNPMFGKGFPGEQNPMFGKTKENAPRWKGGRHIRKDGYVYVVAPADHPYPAYTKSSGTKYILEHRLVMEKHIGRYLLPHEVIHHRDENPTNNAIENLELFSSQAEHVAIAHGNR